MAPTVVPTLVPVPTVIPAVTLVPTVVPRLSATPQPTALPRPTVAPTSVLPIFTPLVAQPDAHVGQSDVALANAGVGKNNNGKAAGKGGAGKGGQNGSGKGGADKTTGVGGPNPVAAGSKADNEPPPRLALHLSDLRPPDEPTPVPVLPHNRLDDPQWRFVFDHWADGIRQKSKHMGEMLTPRDANDNALYGRVRLRLMFDREGNLLSAAVVDSSGNARFDQAVVSFVRLGSPYGPVPQAILIGGVSTLTQVFSYEKGGGGLDWER